MKLFKKVLFTLVLLFGISCIIAGTVCLVSCKNPKEPEGQLQNVTEHIASEEQLPEEQLQEDSEKIAMEQLAEKQRIIEQQIQEKQMLEQQRKEWNNFTTTDLAFFELKGHVKSMTTRDETINFTIDGQLIDKKHEYGRDSQGRIISYTIYYSGLGHDVTDYYIVNEKGQKLRHTCNEISDSFARDVSFFYNAKGLLIKDEGDYDCLGHMVAKYTYKKFDEQGNWTKRTCTSVVELEDEEYYNETRTITYYPFEKE